MRWSIFDMEDSIVRDLAFVIRKKKMAESIHNSGL